MSFAHTPCYRSDLAFARLAVVASAMALVTALPAQSAASAHASLSFNEHIQPILAENCYACHGADPGSRKAGLRLDRPEHAFKPAESGDVVIVPGKPDESPLIKRIESTDEKYRMPPPEAHKTLSPEHVARLRQWIAEGAEYEEHWAFIAPKRPTLPAAPRAQTKWMRNPVDAFIGARLAREKLEPSAEADRRTLARRVALDLTGVIPDPAEVEAFVKDRSSGAYEKLVDRLLASPRYGEHRARYWLDYVRYADTHGVHFDNYRSIWPYRDYVIRAFNANVPFDRFVREQLAGDLLPARTFDELAATGFMRNNLTTNEGGTIPEETYANEVRDRVEAFGATFLGLTTGCAACHDHKFDPISQKDFYSLAAFLGNTQEKPWDLNIAEPPPVLRIPKEETRASAEFVLKAGADLREKLNARREQARELAGAWVAAGHCPEPVSTDRLELRLRLDEGEGDVVRNSAPNAKVKEFKADTNPLIWGENAWLWPSMRMDIATRLALGDLGDVDARDAFSGGGWLMLRAKPGGGVRTGTGNGSLLSRMGDETRRQGAGWDLYQEGTQFIVNLVAEVESEEPAPTPPVVTASSTPSEAAAANATAAVASTPSGTPDVKKKVPAVPAAEAAATIDPRAQKPPVVKRGIQVATRETFPRDEWLHVFFTYDGTRKASGVKIYVNGKPVATDVRLDTLGPKDSIRTDAAMHLGRRDDYQPMRETRFQDVRFYQRSLTPAEVARLPFEDVASEIVARERDPQKWTTDEAFVVADRFFLGEKDDETVKLAEAVKAHDEAFAALTQGGTPTLIALEKETPAYSALLKRGDYFARGERVEPAVPHFLPGLPEGVPPNRRGLAEWLLAPEQPLMARVVVNRIWQEVFGRGLVESAGDFGIMGDRPSHPELLDWLAVEFRESGWDVKRMYKLLVTSATYRQSGDVTPDRLARDPANRLFARGPRFRMDGEMLRDSALAASGLLVEKLGGPSVRPYQPAGIWEEVAMPESNTRTYLQGTGEDLYRRTVYTFWKRASPPASMETFDATSREVVCTRRARTNTPLQVFVTMNDPQWVEAARKLAERALHAADAASARLDFLAKTTLARPLRDSERAVLERSRQAFHARLGDAGAEEDVAALLSVGESAADPNLPAAELAEWTLVASQFLNLDEFLTK